MPIGYLEIVTPDVDAAVASYTAAYGWAFGEEPVAELGHARVAEMPGGGRCGIRAPMADHEEPIVRTYVLVDDIEAAVASAVAAGAVVAHPPMTLSVGTFAILIVGGTQQGLWQH